MAFFHNFSPAQDNRAVRISTPIDKTENISAIQERLGIRQVDPRREEQFLLHVPNITITQLQGGIRPDHQANL